MPRAGAAVNLQHYAVFYVLTSLAWDLPRGILTAALTYVACRPLLRALRRSVRTIGRCTTACVVTSTAADAAPDDADAGDAEDADAWSLAALSPRAVAQACSVTTLPTRASRVNTDLMKDS